MSILWKTYWLYLGTVPIQGILLPVGATEAQVKEKALHDLEIVPGVVCNTYEAPCERRVKIANATVRSYSQTFERTTPEKYWGFIPAGLISEPPQPESPWDTAKREADAARARAMARRARVLREMNDPPENLDPAI